MALLAVLAGCANPITGAATIATGSGSATQTGTSATGTSAPTRPGVVVDVGVRAADGSAFDEPTMDRLVVDLRDRVGHLAGAEVAALDEDTIRIHVDGEDPDAVTRLLQPTSLTIRPVVGYPSPAVGSGSGPVLNDDLDHPQQPAPAADSESWKESVSNGMDSWRCPPPPPPVFGTDATLPLLSCDVDGSMVYLLDPALITGDQVASAVAAPGSSSADWTVLVTFTDAGQQTWSAWTGRHIGEQAAFVLGGSVLTAPTVQSAITDPTTQISGNQTEATAKDLADRLEVARLGMRYEVEAVEVTR